MIALLAGAAICSNGQEIVADPAVTIGIDELVRRVQERDPVLASLNRDVLVAEAAGERALRPREPEIRLGYSSTSHASVLDPFTEVREETITSSETYSERSSSSRDASEVPTASSSLAEQDRETGSSNNSTTRTTVREVTPGRRSTSIRETVSEATGGSFSVNGSSDRGTSSTRGSEQSRVSEQRVEERSYNFDSYEGSDDYSIEVRLYPRNPREKQALRGRAEADATFAEFDVESRKLEIQHEVRASFVELQLLDRERQLLERQIDELNRAVSLQQDLYEAGQVGLDRYADSRMDAIDARLDRDAVRSKADALRDVLAARAGLEDPGQIDVGGRIAVATLSVRDLDPDHLVDAAWLNRRELGNLEQQDNRLVQDLALAQGNRMPWISLLTGQYTYQERYGGKYRDEYSVVAGVTVPVFSWFRDDRDVISRSRESLGRDAQILRERIELDVTHALRRIEQARADVEVYADEHLALRRQIEGVLKDLPEDSPAARRQRVDLGRTLVTLRTRELELTRAYARAALHLEEVLGAPLDTLSRNAPARAQEEAGHEG